MPDIYSALMGQTPTDPDQMNALVNALRGQKLVGQLGMLAGDPFTAGVGHQLDTSADTQATQIGGEIQHQQQMKTEAEWRAAQEAHMTKQEEQSAAALKETMRYHDMEQQAKMWQYGINPKTGAVDPSFEQNAQGIAHYEQAPINVSMSRNPRNLALMGRVDEIAQSEGRPYDQTLYQTKQAGQKYFTTGAGGQLMQAGGTAVNHLGTLNTAVDNLDNTNAPVWNRIKNTAKTWAGSPDVTNFEAVKKQVADEVAKFAVANSAAGGTAVFDRKEVEGLVDNAQGRNQLKGIMARWTDLMQGRAKEMEQRYNNSIPDFPGTPYARREFATYWDQDSRNALGIHTQAEKNAAGGQPYAGFSARPVGVSSGPTGRTLPNPNAPPSALPNAVQAAGVGG